MEDSSSIKRRLIWVYKSVIRDLLLLPREFFKSVYKNVLAKFGNFLKISGYHRADQYHVKMSELEKCLPEEAGINDPENVPQNVPECIFQNITEKFETKMNRKRKRNENLEEENLKIIKACKYCDPDTVDFAKDRGSPDR